MSFHMISALRSIVPISMALTAFYICIPHAIKFWFLWKETRKQKNLSVAITYAIGAFFLLSGCFLIFMKAVGSYNV